MDLPEAERPVSQMVRPRWLRSWLRSRREREGCQVMLLMLRVSFACSVCGGDDDSMADIVVVWYVVIR